MLSSQGIGVSYLTFLMIGLAANATRGTLSPLLDAVIGTGSGQSDRHYRR